MKESYLKLFKRISIEVILIICIELLILFGSALILILTSNTEFISSQLNPSNQNGSENITLLLIVFQSFTVLFFAFVRRRKAMSEIIVWEKAGVQFTVLMKCVIGASIGIFLCILAYFHTLITYHFFGPNEVLISRYAFVDNLSLTGKIIFLFCSTFIAPIAEEIYFREIMFGSLLRLGFPLIALAFSCIAFAIIHLDLMSILIYLIYGLGLALLYQKTRSLLTSIIAHIAINLVSLSFITFT